VKCSKRHTIWDGGSIKQFYVSKYMTRAATRVESLVPY